MHSPERQPGALGRRRLLERLELLCSCGAGIAAIAAPVADTLNEIFIGKAGSVFWVPRGADPGGFYHAAASVEMKDMFVTRFDELFNGPGQENFQTLTESTGPKIGHILDPDYRELFWSGNVYKYLCEPMQHRYFLDIRIEDHAGPVGVAVIWRGADDPITLADIATALPIKPMLDRAVEVQRPDVMWRSRRLPGPAHLVTDVGGSRLLAISPAADKLLMESHWIAGQVSMLSQPRQVPPFMPQLAAMFAANGEAELTLPITNGRVVAHATPHFQLDENGERRPLMFVSLDHEVALEVLAVEYLCDLSLSPLQRKIALLAMTGGERSECGQRFNVSAEALKKHLRVIWAETGATTWSELSIIAERLPR